MRNSLFVLLLVVAIFGCDTTGPVEEEVEEQPLLRQGDFIFPLALRNAWTWVFTVEEDGVVTRRDTTRTWVVRRDSVVFEGDTLDVFVLSSGAMMRHGPKGLNRYLTGLRVDGAMQEQLLLLYPGEPGDEWFVDHGDYRDPYVYVSNDTSCSAVVGTFQCVQLRALGSSWTRDEFYAPGIGLIWSEAVIQRSNMVVRHLRELIDYRLHDRPGSRGGHGAERRDR